MVYREGMSETPPSPVPVSVSTPEEINKALADADVPPIHGPTAIDMNDFAKVDLRIGKVLSAERVPKSEKLLRMQVSFGDFQRQILAGVGKSYAPSDLLNKQFVFIVNLAPRKMMGHESHGMMLASGDDGDLALLRPTCVVADGSRAR